MLSRKNISFHILIRSHFKSKNPLHLCALYQTNWIWHLWRVFHNRYKSTSRWTELFYIGPKINALRQQHAEKFDRLNRDTWKEIKKSMKQICLVAYWQENIEQRPKEYALMNELNWNVDQTYGRIKESKSKRYKTVHFWPFCFDHLSFDALTYTHDVTSAILKRCSYDYMINITSNMDDLIFFVNCWYRPLLFGLYKRKTVVQIKFPYF